MAETASLSIILTAFNERDNIYTIIESIIDLSLQYKLEIIAVDDNSPDGTSEVVLELARQYSFIRLVRRVGGSGLSSAIKEGLLNACHGLRWSTSYVSHQTVKKSSKRQRLRPCCWQQVSSRICNQRSHQWSRKCFYFCKLSCQKSLSKRYRHLTDYMSGFFAIDLKQAMPAFALLMSMALSSYMNY